MCESSGGKLEWFEKADPKTKGFAKMLIRRIQSIVMDRGKRIEDAAASFLAETIGADEARLGTEIEKLLTYAGDKPVVTRPPSPLTWRREPRAGVRDALAAQAQIGRAHV